MNNIKASLSIVRLLYIEDKSADIKLLEKLLSKSEIANFEITAVSSVDEAKKYGTDSHDLALISLNLPDTPGIGAVSSFRKQNQNIPIVAITDTDDEMATVCSVQAGVQDCLVKGKFDCRLLVRVLCFAMEREQTLAMLADLRSQQEDHFLNHDQLTGLPNKKYLIDFLNCRIKEDKYRNLRWAILQFELEGLQQVNTTLGISFADTLLQMIAKRLQKACGDKNLVVRFSGTQFVIVFHPDPDKDSIYQFSNTLLSLLRDPIDIHGEKIIVTTSIGISLYPKDGHDATDLLEKSVMGASAAKKIGTHNYHFYSSEMKKEKEERHKMQRDLPKALDNDELFLLYQPKIEIASGKIIGAEALLRWQHPELGLIPPAHFIPIAESENVIIPIGKWIIETCLKLVKSWQTTDHRLNIPRISINISPVQLGQWDFLDMVTLLLGSYSEQVQFIEFEITESTIMRSPDANITTLNKIREMGIPIAIDDFGTGYSSLSYLNSLPADIVKIDKSFITDVHLSNKNAEIVRSTINLVHKLNLIVIAEGVEIEEEVKFLKENDCDQIQGYYFSRPVPTDEFLQLIKKGTFKIP